MERSALCEMCVYWNFLAMRQIDGPDKPTVSIGECREQPPVVLHHRDDRRETVWPQTRGTEWCGKYALAADRVAATSGAR